MLHICIMSYTHPDIGADPRTTMVAAPQNVLYRSQFLEKFESKFVNQVWLPPPLSCWTTAPAVESVLMTPSASEAARGADEIGRNMLTAAALIPAHESHIFSG